MTSLYRIFFGITLLFLIAGCGRQESRPDLEPEPQAPVTPEDLFVQWREIPEAGHEFMDIGRAIVIANALAQQGPDGLEPILDVLASPEEDPVAKMLAVICLSSHMNESFLPRLLELSEPGHESITRGGAIHLLGAFPDGEVQARLRESMTDDDKHVSKVATFVLLRRGDIDAFERTLALWDGNDISVHDRNEIILALPDAQASRHLRLFEEALCNRDLDVPARKRAIQTVGALGDSEALPLLEACLDRETNAELRTALEYAVRALQSRYRPKEHVPSAAAAPEEPSTAVE